MKVLPFNRSTNTVETACATVGEDKNSVKLSRRRSASATVVFADDAIVVASPLHERNPAATERGAYPEPDFSL